MSELRSQFVFLLFTANINKTKNAYLIGNIPTRAGQKITQFFRENDLRW
jgi:hypothetical protein